MSGYQRGIPSYDDAFFNLIYEVVEGLTLAHPFLGQIRRKRVHHLGPTRNVSGPNPVDHMPVEFENLITFEHVVIREGRLEDITVSMYEVAKQVIDQAMIELVRVLGSVTEATGNLVSANGKPFSWDLFLDAIDLIELDFDSAGNPLFPLTLAGSDVHAKAAETPFLDEHRDRLRHIVDSKKAEHDAQKRTRRLPRQR